MFIVDSNDSLYGYDPKFISEVDSMITTVIDELLTQLKVLEQSQVGYVISITTVLHSLDHHEFYQELKLLNNKFR